MAAGGGDDDHTVPGNGVDVIGGVDVDVDLAQSELTEGDIRTIYRRQFTEIGRAVDIDTTYVGACFGTARLRAGYWQSLDDQRHHAVDAIVSVGRSVNEIEIGLVEIIVTKEGECWRPDGFVRVAKAIDNDERPDGVGDCVSNSK